MQLYKYMSRNIGEIVLNNRTLRWSTPGTLNDPFDAQFDLHVDVDRDALKAATLAKIWEDYSGPAPVRPGNAVGVALRMIRAYVPGISRADLEREFGDAIEQGCARRDASVAQLQADLRPLIAQTKILCLTENPINTIMWAHYGEGHQGLALRFRSVPDLDSPWCMAKAMEYRAEMPRLVDVETLSDLMSGRGVIDGRARLHQQIYTKGLAWAYEQEWRISSGAGRNPDASFEDIPFHSLELGAVILGCRMPATDVVRVSELATRLYPHAEILQVRQAPREFQFELMPLAAEALGEAVG